MKISTDVRHTFPRPASTFSRIGRNSIAGLAALACLGVTALPAAAGDFAVPLAPPPVPEDEWQFDLAVYALMPQINTTAANGFDINIGFDQILESLDMTAMTAFVARKGRWSVGTDLIYLAMGNDVYGPVGPRGSGRVDLNLKTWIINPVVGYTVAEGDWGHLDVMGGARYLYMKSQTGLSVGTILGNTYGYASSSGDSWAGIVGVRGQIELSGHWFMPYYLDVGTGDSDLTWQGYIGIGYRLENFDLVLGYRYLDWDLGTGGALTSLDVEGPQLGVRFQF